MSCKGEINKRGVSGVGLTPSHDIIQRYKCSILWGICLCLEPLSGKIEYMTNGTLTYDNGQIYYEVAGSGDPIVFVHGFTLDHTMWKPQIEHFSKNYQVIAYDVRGFGKSSLPNGLYDHSLINRA